ncbi:MAG TPA: Uma2 family endonuclease [Egibacteraceae bacterium]|jgi:Uma2 family endonuclease|nr:Uma2 family endonuclease [Egibacteraceae bacterium]
MGTPAGARLTYREYEALPEPDDGSRCELVDGQVVVTPPPDDPHQQALRELTIELGLWARAHAAEVLPGPGLLVAEDSELIPDLIVVLADHLDEAGRRAKTRADLVVEISSPSTRRRDLGRKRELYQAAGIPEYWFVDRERGEVLVHRRKEGGYAPAVRLTRGTSVTSPLLPGFTLPVDRLF